MKIHYYTKFDNSEKPWKDILISSQIDIDAYGIKPYISIKGLAVIRRHHCTYLTGKDTCHAHQYATMLAGAMLSASYDSAPSLKLHDDSQDTPATPKRVLWIDTHRSPHSCAHFFRQITSRFNPEQDRFFMLSIDALGVFRDDHYPLVEYIDYYIDKIKPTLVVIDDIDHLMPICGINVAHRFQRVIRDYINHSDISFLLIGYNELNKRASTTGNLGKALFTQADTVLSVTTRHNDTTVRFVRSVEVAGADASEFHFTIGDDGLPLEAEAPSPDGATSPIDDETLTQIIPDVLPPDQAIDGDQLIKRVTARHRLIKQTARYRSIIEQAQRLHLIKCDEKSPTTFTLNTLTPPVNNLLTLPPQLPTVSLTPPSPPSTPSTPSLPSTPSTPSPCKHPA